VSSPKPAARAITRRSASIDSSSSSPVRWSVLGFEIERRPRADRRPVEPLAVRRRPQARILAGRREILASQRVEEGPIGGIRQVAHDLADAFAIGFIRDLDHRRHDRRFDRHAEHSLDLGDGPLGDDTRRGQPRRDAVPQDLGVGRHERGVGLEPRDEGIEPFGRVGRLELGELRQELLRPTHLVDDAQLVEPLVVLFELELGDDLEHVAGDPVLGGQSVDVDGGRLGRGPFHQGPRPGPAVGSRVLESVVVALVAVQRRGGGRELEYGLPEAVGQVVDGRQLVLGNGHARVSCGARTPSRAVVSCRR